MKDPYTRIQELQQPQANGMTLTLEWVAHIINWEYDTEYTADDIEEINKGNIPNDMGNALKHD